jgi:hypothetical protein
MNDSSRTVAAPVCTVDLDDKTSAEILKESGVEKVPKADEERPGAWPITAASPPLIRLVSTERSDIVSFIDAAHGVEFADAPEEARSEAGSGGGGVLDFLFKKSASPPAKSHLHLRRRTCVLQWACPVCAHVNASDADPTCAQCRAAFPALLVDPGLVSLPPGKRVASYRSVRNSAGGVAAGALLGPLGLVAAASLAASANVAHIRFQEAIRCAEVRLRLQALTAAEPMRGVRAVVRRGGGLGPEEAQFLAARDRHVARHLQTFLGGARGSIGSDSAEAAALPLRVAIAVSGGGLRATTCHLAAMQVAHAHGLLDCCTYVAGLSGSCWSLGAWYAEALRMLAQQQQRRVSLLPQAPGAAESDEKVCATAVRIGTLGGTTALSSFTVTCFCLRTTVMLPGVFVLSQRYRLHGPLSDD